MTSLDAAATSTPATAPIARRSGWPPVVLCIIVLAMLLRPGDAPWINDEPRLILYALHFSGEPTDDYLIHLAFTPAQFGLKGTRGAIYGPGAVWFYQVLLAITHNPRALVVLHALIAGGLTALAVYWLARVMRVSAWLAVVTMLSPWLWHYSRQLWDNSLNIPLSALMLAAYADFLSTRRRWPLRLAVLCAAIMPLVHFMSLAIVVPVMLHLALVERRAMFRFKWSLLGIIALVEFAAWPYWSFLRDHYHHTVPGGTSAPAGWLYPLLGAHHITAAGLGNILGNHWLRSVGHVGSSIVFAAQTVSLLVYPLCWWGMAIAFSRARRVFGAGSDATVIDHLCAICLATWICQTVLDGLENAYEGPHYFNATWIVYAVFVWIAIDRLLARWCSRPFGGAMFLSGYAAALLIVLVGAELKIIRDSGSRNLGYGTTLGRQTAAMREVNRYSPQSPRDIQVPQWANYSWTFDVLRDFTEAAPDPRPAAPLLIRYGNASADDAQIIVETETISPPP